MNKQEVIDVIRKNGPLIRERFGVDRLGLFGSYVRERQKKQSDIDILVSFARGIDLFDLVELREFLESRLHHKVDHGPQADHQKAHPGRGGVCLNGGMSPGGDARRPDPRLHGSRPAHRLERGRGSSARIKTQVAKSQS